MSGENHSEEDTSFDWTDEEEDAGGATTAIGNGASEEFSEIGKEMDSRTRLISDFVRMGFQRDMVLKAIADNGEDDPNALLQVLLGSSSSEPSTSQSRVSSQFINMGFPPEMVSKVIAEIGEENEGMILENLLNLKALDGIDQKDNTKYDPKSPNTDEDDVSDLFSDGSCVADEEVENLFDEDDILAFLLRKGYSEDEIKCARDRCEGEEASVTMLEDMMFSARLAKEADYYDDLLSEEEYEEKPFVHGRGSGSKRKGKWAASSSSSLPGKVKQRQKVCSKSSSSKFTPPTNMVGFGLPNEPVVHRSREIPDAAIGPPFFYYENVALAPKDVWATMSECLYGVEPEFVDSKHFCAAARKRGYIHNLPIHGRFPLEPRPPLTIQEALPHTIKWWPSWDTRTNMNCIQGVCTSAKTTERIRVALAESTDPPPPNVQQFVNNESRKWNLVWVGRNKLAPMEPDEIEFILGFPKNHTRGGGISSTERYKCLGNTFQVDTVAYHLSVLKNMFPHGMRVLSLFSGIGGAEVALHRLGIFLKVVVAVEILEVNRNILKGWWEQTDQKGILIDIPDVRDVSHEKLQKLVASFGGFDLVVGGSPCNNISGANRVSRHGLEGEQSCLFYDYSRILSDLKSLMA